MASGPHKFWYKYWRKATCFLMTGRVFYLTQSQCLDCSTLPVMAVCIIKPSQMKLSVSQVWGHAWIRMAVDFRVSKRRRESPRMLESLESFVRSEWEHPKWERHQEKKGKTWAMPWSKHSTQDEHWRLLWNSGGDKKHPLLSTWENNRSYQRWTGGICLPFIITCENKRPCKADWHSRSLI